MAKGSGGGGKPGRSGGGSGQPRPGDSALTANMRKYYEPGGATVQQLNADGTVQATHAKATIIIYGDRTAEVWSSRDGTKAFRPVAGSLRTYNDPMKALGEFEKRTGMIT